MKLYVLWIAIALTYLALIMALEISFRNEAMHYNKDWKFQHNN